MMMSQYLRAQAARARRIAATTGATAIADEVWQLAIDLEREADAVEARKARLNALEKVA
jgi:hypothetical protein